MSSNETTPDMATAKPEPRPSRLAGVREWFWRGRALRDARAAQLAERHLVLWETRARVAAEVAIYALDPAGPWLAGDARHLACGLFAESIGWSLRLASSRAPHEADSPAPNEVDRPPGRDELAQLIATHQPRLLDAARDRETLDRVTSSLLQRDFEITSLPTEEVERSARELRQVAERMLRPGPGSPPAIDRLVVQRVARVGGLALLLIAGIWGIALLRERLEQRADLAFGKPWVASSSYETACQSPAHHCGADKGYFFHTQEEKNPWLEIDLLKSERFSAVRVFNRQDCCAERIAPLVVEVSTDHRTWRQVARKTEPFETWKATFAPVSARWVRFRIARRSHLHLYDVRVLR
jgi:hypothetical protein